MFPEPGPCHRKDKRLLVLLAFGAIIALCRLADVLLVRETEERTWLWLEVRDGAHQVYRCAHRRHEPAGTACFDGMISPDLDRSVLRAHLERQGAAALVAGEGATAVSATLSPRLAFQLGLPFPINLASEEELTILPGIGPALAARIARYRENRGRIADKDELQLVRGIGRRLSDRLAPYLVF